MEAEGYLDRHRRRAGAWGAPYLKDVPALDRGVSLTSFGVMMAQPAFAWVRIG